MRLKIVLVDDDHHSRSYLADQIRQLGDSVLDVREMPPPRDLNLTRLLDEKADLYLVDYELDVEQPNGSRASYRGMTLAARLREVQPAYPIALLTRSSLPSWSQARRTALAGRVFDEVLYKEENLRDDPDTTYLRLMSLARGYQTLRKCTNRSVDTLLELLRTDPVGKEIALEALPPDNGWQEFEAAHWIRSVLLNYPGVVYDDRHAATALGISLDSFRQEPVLEILQPAMYRGPFLEEGERWWRHRLFDIANRLCSSRDHAIGLREGFRLIASAELGLELEPSRDAETGITLADTVCYLLKVPVRIETSLPYQPDARPSVMEKARVSFKAIRESNDIESRFIDAASRTRLNEIRAAS